MTVEKYRPTSLDDCLTRIAEECSEVIKVVCKAQRFGLNDINPAKGKRNIDLLFAELKDIEDAKEDFTKCLYQIIPAPYDQELQRKDAIIAGLHVQIAGLEMTIDKKRKRKP
jgi:hypothetical protein